MRPWWFLFLASMVAAGFLGVLVTSWGHYQVNRLRTHKFVPKWLAVNFTWEMALILWVVVTWGWLITLFGATIYG